MISTFSKIFDLSIVLRGGGHAEGPRHRSSHPPRHQGSCTTGSNEKQLRLVEQAVWTRDGTCVGLERPRFCTRFRGQTLCGVAPAQRSFIDCPHWSVEFKSFWCCALDFMFVCSGWRVGVAATDRGHKPYEFDCAFDPHRPYQLSSPSIRTCQFSAWAVREAVGSECRKSCGTAGDQTEQTQPHQTSAYAAGPFGVIVAA